MTKLELMMTNNELEARVIELETKVKGLDRENDRLLGRLEAEQDTNQELTDQLHNLERSIEEVAAERPALSYEVWYSMIHPTPGGEPDRAMLKATEGTRIIA